MSLGHSSSMCKKTGDGVDLEGSVRAPYALILSNCWWLPERLSDGDCAVID